MATITPAKKPKYAVIGVRIIRMTYRTVLSEPEPISVQVVEWVVLRNVRQTKERLRLL